MPLPGKAQERLDLLVKDYHSALALDSRLRALRDGLVAWAESDAAQLALQLR